MSLDFYQQLHRVYICTPLLQSLQHGRDLKCTLTLQIQQHHNLDHRN